eukprot:symbB.v1.2.040925.t1/scaffold7658.1/size10031/1
MDDDKVYRLAALKVGTSEKSGRSLGSLVDEPWNQAMFMRSPGHGQDQWIETMRYATQKEVPKAPREKDLGWVVSLGKDFVGFDTWGAAKREVGYIPPDLTQSLISSPLKPVEILLVALAQASGKFLESRLWVDLEAHGRDTNFAHTVGWFTELKAVEMVKHESLELALREAKNRCRSQQTWSQTVPTICINYHGQAGPVISEAQCFTVAPEWETLSHHDLHPQNQREYLLEIEAMLVHDSDGCSLRIEWIYDIQLGESMARWLQEFLHEVAVVIPFVAASGNLGRCLQAPCDLLAPCSCSVSTFDAWVAEWFDGQLADMEEVYPCTPLQEGMMAENLLDSSANVEQLPLLQRGNGTQWRNAWTSVVQRHGALRARLAPAPQSGRRFWQVVFKAGSVPAIPEWQEGVWDVHAGDEDDCEDHPPNEQRNLSGLQGKEEHRGRALHLHPHREPCNFRWMVQSIDASRSHPVLHRSLLLRSPGNGFRVQRWGYSATGGDMRLLIDPAPRFAVYADHVLRASQAAAERNELQRFWLQQLDGWETGSDLEIVKAKEHSEFEQFHVDLPLPVLPKVDQGITSAALLHAAWAIVLASHQDREDVVFGVVLSGRDVPIQGIEGMVGLLICTLPLRVQISRSASCIDLATSIQQSLRDLAAHQFCNMAEIRDWCGLRGATQELFQTMLVFENYPEEEADERVQAGGK